MRYALLIYEDESIYGPDKTDSASAEIVAQRMSFTRELGEIPDPALEAEYAPRLWACSHLDPVHEFSSRPRHYALDGVQFTREQ